ncbi:MAG TPA: efflux RND transporter periplasmic adaptor subunit [Anaerolineae bacterium]|jgi:multidrug resistance efflux pump
MDKTKLRLIALISALGLLFTAANTGGAAAMRPSRLAAATVTASGFLEADEVAMSSELGGRIAHITVAEGADVRTGDPLVELDHDIAEAELHIARAKAQTARAALAQVLAGTRAEDIRMAEAAVRVAEAGRASADQARTDASMLLNNQQALDLQIIQMSTQIEVTRHQLDTAVAAQSASQLVKDRFDVPFQDIYNWQAWIGVNASGATYDGARAALTALQAERNQTSLLRLQFNSAESAYAVASSMVTVTQARLADLRAGATSARIGVAEALVRSADAAVAAAQTKVRKLSLTAPVNGQVSALNLNAGELASPGAAILTLTDLDHLSLVAYVPADKLGLVSLGASVAVAVDGFPGRSFTGEVVHIADKAEFVPNNVQTAEDRAALVYAVKLRLANPDHALKPGVPADATFTGN